MKKQISVIVLVLLLTASIGGFAYGAEEEPVDTDTTTIVPDMNFTGTEIKLSLEQATKLMMTSSSGINDAKVKLEQDKASTEKTARQVSLLRKQDRESKSTDFVGSSPSKTEREMGKLTVEYLKAQAENNYEAAVNNLKSKLFKIYYELLQAEDQVRISKENVQIQETLLKNVQLKYSLGTASKQDTLQAEVALNQKKVDLQTAENDLKVKKMEFNQFFEYPLMQNVKLADTLEAPKPSNIKLADAIKLALKNRNEIAAAKFGVEYKTLNLKETGNNYSASSGYYVTAKAELSEAKKTNRDTPGDIELDVRSKYMDMEASKSAVDLAKKSLEMSKESFRLMQLSYDAGLKTLTDVQKTQVEAYNAEVSYSKSLLAYNLATMAYEQATTVGTKAF
ncbi:TolC family protein [Anaerovorax odorimutans]|uniref:TolC family protein n=1 Tax=Anaerovorax odorimutans TaxID=109327 RepID=UPI0004238BCE|nr:TolC family protein [Anaerovorax odorimutans]